MRRSGPDSVVSWGAALLCSLISMVLYGVVRLSGVLFVASMERFRVERQSASFPYILCDSVQAILGPLVGLLSLRFGVMRVVTTGGFIAAAGIGLCFLADDIRTVALLWGVIFGFGFGLISLLLPVIITQHFVEKRATAISIVYFGSYVGFSFLPPLTNYLIETYGLSGTYLILCGLMMHVIPLAMLIREPGKEEDMYMQENKDSDSIVMKSENGSVAKLKYDQPKFVPCDVETPTRKLSTERNNISDLTYCSISSQDFNENIKYDRANSCHSKESSKDDNTTKELDITSSKVSSVHEHRSRKMSTCSIVSIPINCMGYIPERRESKIQFQNSLHFMNKRKESKSYLDNNIYGRSLFVYQGSTEDSMKNSKGTQIFSINFIRGITGTHKWSPPQSVTQEHKLSPEAKAPNAFWIFAEPVFLLVLFVAGVYGACFIAFISIIVDFGMDIGMQASDGTMIIMIFSVCSNVGLLSFGWVTDCGYMKLTNFAGLLFLLRTVTLLLIPYASNFNMLAPVTAVQGFCESSLANLFPLIIADYYTDAVHSMAISCVMFLCGPMYLATPPLIGLFRDTMGSYTYLFHLMGFLSFICSILLFATPVLSRCRCIKDNAILSRPQIKTRSQNIDPS